MDEKFEAILDSLPPKPPRSKLEPYAELIRELRKRSRSYRDIASILKDRCDLSVGVHTLYAFVRTRSLGTAGADHQENRDSKLIGDEQKKLQRQDTAVMSAIEQTSSGVRLSLRPKAWAGKAVLNKRQRDRL
jgi:IS30 family transposase